MPLDQPLLNASFFGPWVPQADSQERTRHHYLSLATWYESAKFMPHLPQMRDAVLFSPTTKEAKKFTKARQAQWRSDWNLVRKRVLLAGMGFLHLERQDLNLTSWRAEEWAEQLAEMRFPARFLQDCVASFQLWAQGPKIATFGAVKAPEPVVARKLSKVVDDKPWTLLTLCNGRACWRVHDWALSMYVPVAYIGTPQSRTATSLRDQLITGCDQLLVFEARGGRANDAVIRRARMLEVPLALEIY